MVFCGSFRVHSTLTPHEHGLTFVGLDGEAVVFRRERHED